MPEETGQSPEVQVDTPPAVIAQTDTLPDSVPDVNVDKLKIIESEKKALEEKYNAAIKDKEEFAARLKDNQEYINRTRKIEPQKVDVPLPRRTFDEYLNDFDSKVDKEFENDPKQGLKSIVRKIITDVAYDRDLQQQDYDKRIANAELNAFKRVLKLDPEKAKTMQAVERLEQDRPDLSSLTFDQKLEWVRMAEGAVKPQPVSRTQLDREVELSSDVGGGRSRQAERMPAWASSPDVIRENNGHFKTKQEMIDWANVKTADDAARLQAKMKKGQV
jgi:hypothetical protein